MDMSYMWEMKGRREEMRLFRVYTHPVLHQSLHNIIGFTKPVKFTDGTTKWLVRTGIVPTYHDNKRKAMRHVAANFMIGLTMRGKNIPDLTNAYWSTEMIGEHRFDVLRVTVNGEMHQVASIDERGSPQYWAAIRGKGQVPLEGANSFEEARAVCVALIRMG